MKPAHHFVLNHIKAATKTTSTRAGEYSSLLFFVINLLVFVAIIMLQTRPRETFTAVNTHREFLFSETSGTVQYSDGRVTERVAGVDAVKSWIKDTVLDNVFVDPSCGDGLCEAPLEYGSIFEGRFGCSADCGVFENVTDVTVTFDVYEEDYQLIASLGVENVGWNLCWIDEGICVFETNKPFFNAAK